MKALPIKGVVVELKDTTCIILTANGIFEEVRKPDRNVLTGDEITSSPVLKKSVTAALPRLAVPGRLLKFVAAAAILMLAVFLGQQFSGIALAEPQYYVSLDINPSLELGIDGDDRIVSARALNPDGEKLLAGTKVKRAQLSQGVSSLVNEAVRQGYMSNGEDNIIITTVTQGEAGAGSVSDPGVEVEMAGPEEGMVAAAIEETLTASGVQSRVVVEKVKPDFRKQARDKGLSTGKLLLQERARQNNIQLETGEVEEDSVRQIVSAKKISMEKLFPGVKKIDAGPRGKDVKPVSQNVRTPQRQEPGKSGQETKVPVKIREIKPRDGKSSDRENPAPSWQRDVDKNYRESLKKWAYPTAMLRNQKDWRAQNNDSSPSRENSGNKGNNGSKDDRSDKVNR